jgi:hypothetical protein
VKIVTARWTPRVNELLIRCHCGREFWYRADRWNVHCPACRAASDMSVLRIVYHKRKKKEMNNDRG